MDKIIVLDFGGQYCHLISRRIRDMGVFSEILPNDTSREDLESIDGLKGVILSGGAASVDDENSPRMKKDVLDVSVPVLGICYGHQLISYLEKGEMITGGVGEYGITDLKVERGSTLLKGMGTTASVWMNHRDKVKSMPEGYSVTASTKDCPVAAFEKPERGIYGVQFHPEVTHTEKGFRILENFAFGICGAKGGWDIKEVIEGIKSEITEKLGKRKALIGLSGGVDSSTAALLIGSVIGSNLTAVYVDTGLMRHGETDFMKRVFSGYGLDLRIVEARDRFFGALKGVTDSERKRKIIGKLFIDIFDEIAVDTGAEILVQGTIYSDRIESGITRHSSTIKSHHNVGGLPEEMKLEVYEPLRDLYKDEVRRIAKELGLSDEITGRQVFPGPGLAVRIAGEVTPEKAGIVREAGRIIDEELKMAGIYDEVWMGFAILLPVKTVGVQGDERSYKYPVVVRIIDSKDAMTANFSKVPLEVLERISTRITNEIMRVNRVLYDITNKPPATMEWE
ncbi:MAG: glutamine-hydrolyzing GMP synthase [Candidatus Aenigmarchaeota archaeon]|nr:glutamine-hydrolyzing GMP synthase [Candidatus Aenigmarchaeota archaeon]